MEKMFLIQDQGSSDTNQHSFLAKSHPPIVYLQPKTIGGQECNITDVYLESSRTSTIEILCKNSSRLQAVNYFRKNAPSQMFVLVLNTPLYCASNAFCGMPSLCMFVQRKPSKEFSNVIDIFVNRNSFQRFSSLKLSKLSFIFIMLTRPGYSRILATLQSFYNRVDVKLSYCMSTAVCRFSSLCITLQK